MSTTELVDSQSLHRKLWDTLREKNLGKKSKNEISSIIKNNPDLILKPMNEDVDQSDRQGQTPLHIAVARQELDTVKMLLDGVQRPGQRNALLKLSATGKAFEGTAMSGQIVLSIAALTFNKEMVKLLLGQKYGADIEAENSYEENVFHSLVSYATNENVNQVWEMINFIVKLYKDFPTLITTMWWQTNATGYTPLLLAVKYGQHELFNKILAIPNAFSTTRLTDGMQDVELVDVTQIDTVAYENYRLHQQKPPPESPGSTKSAMKIIFTLNRKSMENFADIPAIRKCVEIKWKRYRYPYFIWAAVHVILLAFVCLAAVKRSGGLETWSAATSWAPLIFNLFYSLLRIAMVWYQIRDSFRSFPATELHNRSYMLLMILSSIAALIDHIWFFANQMTFVNPSLSEVPNLPMVLLIMTDFTFLSFFLRTFRRFSFFTVMLQRVIYRDIFRFVIFILLNLLSFSILIYVVSGVADGDDGSGFLNITSDMSKLMLGLEDLDLENPQEAWLVQILYYLFVISTYILALNSLIALMSGTCSTLAEKKEVLWKIQMLSVIVFLDNFTFLPKFIRIKAGRTRGEHDQRTWIELKVTERSQSGYNQRLYRPIKRRPNQKRNVIGMTTFHRTAPKLEITDTIADEF